MTLRGPPVIRVYESCFVKILLDCLGLSARLFMQGTTKTLKKFCHISMPLQGSETTIPVFEW
jgi:hypothetical protein